MLALTGHQAGVLELRVRDAQMVLLHLRSRGKALQQFLDAWTDDDIAEGLGAASRDSRLDPAVRQLARTFPEQRSWKPIFPFYRP